MPLLQQSARFAAPFRIKRMSMSHSRKIGVYEEAVFRE